jgi:phenylalanyl-tRNA synthetase beta chain
LAKAGFGAAPVTLANPLSEEQSVLRPTLLVSLMESAGRNQSAGNSSVRMFELSKVFRLGNPPLENWRLGLVFSSDAVPHWREKGRGADFYDFAGILEKFFAVLAGQTPKFEPKESLPGFFEREFALKIGIETLGLAGELSYPWTKEYHIKPPCFLAEVFGEPLLKLAGAEKPFKPFSRFPSIQRDAALIAPAELFVGNIFDEIEKVSEPLLEKVELFDLYTGPQAGEGKKSLALSFRFRSGEKTLTDAEADDAHEKLVNRLVSRFGLVWRKK